MCVRLYACVCVIMWVCGWVEAAAHFLFLSSFSKSGSFLVAARTLQSKSNYNRSLPSFSSLHCFSLLLHLLMLE